MDGLPSQKQYASTFSKLEARKMTCVLIFGFGDKSTNHNADGIMFANGAENLHVKISHQS